MQKYPDAEDVQRLVLTWEDGRSEMHTIPVRYQVFRQEKWEWYWALMKRLVAEWESILKACEGHTSSDALWLVP